MLFHCLVCFVCVCACLCLCVLKVSLIMATLEDHHLEGISQRQAQGRENKRQRQREESEDEGSKTGDYRLDEHNGDKQTYESQLAQPLD